jgi:hypothetical protein
VTATTCARYGQGILVAALLLAVAGDTAIGAATARATLRIKMNAATLEGPGAHVAVWLGANDRLRDWIQGGIEIEYGNGHPYVYLETGHAGKQTRLIRTATRFGTVSTFRLYVIGQYWQVVTNGRLSPIRIRIVNPDIQQHVEIDRGTVSVSIDGLVQHG